MSKVSHCTEVSYNTASPADCTDRERSNDLEITGCPRPTNFACKQSEINSTEVIIGDVSNTEGIEANKNDCSNHSRQQDVYQASSVSVKDSDNAKNAELKSGTTVSL